MIDRLRVVGPYRGSSGYDRHTRAFVKQFVELGVAVELIQLEGWSIDLPADQRPIWFDALNAPVGADTVLHFTMPPHAVPAPDMRNVNYTMFEATEIPADWVDRARRQDRVVVPTETCREAWVASGVERERVRVAPLGVDGDLFSRPSPPLPLLTYSGRPVAGYGTRFLNVAELRPRKNIVGLLRTWIKATRADDDAVLVLKPSIFQRRALPQFLEDVLAMQEALGRRLAEAAPVVVLPAVFSDEQMVALFRSATHYVSLSHGEGWDQVMMEAAVAGLQLMAPRHSAYLEYLTEADAELVPAAPGPATFEGRMGAEDALFFAGLSWWHPDEDAAAEIIRRIVDKRAIPKSSPGARLAREYGWRRSARSLLEALPADAG